MTGARIGVDVGGTFTDIVCVTAGGRLHTQKVLSSVGDYAAAILQGIRAVLSDAGLGPAQVAEIRHGTTVASNAILEGKGARTGLITTKGFRDVLEIGNLRIPKLYDIGWQKPAPLVERYLRLELDERVDAKGEVETPLDQGEAERLIRRLMAEGVDAIAVCLLNSFINPAHERGLEATLARVAPGIPASISHVVLPEMKEYERTSTTVINAYVTPVVSRYLTSLMAKLKAERIAAPLFLMRSSGGLLGAETAAKLPIHIIESGPAGGVIGAHALAERLGIGDVISFDMGGTTAKAALVERGQIARSAELQVGGGMMIGSRLLTGGGYLVKVPAIDLAEVGAGGGSILAIDRAGWLQVGPESAGASPGPICYDQGGEAPTITDANLVLGYINPEHLVGGGLRLNAGKARERFAGTIAGPLGLEPAAAAYGAYEIAVAKMTRAIRAVSTERGRDPRKCNLIAFGGNGPLFAAAIARSLSIKRILVPPAPGLFSAVGFLNAQLEHHRSRSCRTRLDRVLPAELEALWTELAAAATAGFAEDGFPDLEPRIERIATMRYVGQVYELAVAAPSVEPGGDLCAYLKEEFALEHERHYGHRAGPDEPVEIVTLQVYARAPFADAGYRLSSAGDDRPGRSASARRCYFGPDQGWIDTEVVGRSQLRDGRAGPLIVEEYDATCLVPKGARASLDELGNIVIELK